DRRAVERAGRRGDDDQEGRSGRQKDGLQQIVIRSILALALCGVAIAAPPPPKLPRVAPDLQIRLTPGAVSPAQFKGKAVVLALIMTGCPHCQETVQYLSSLQKQHGVRGLQVLAAAFNDDAPTATVGFAQQFKPAFPVGY